MLYAILITIILVLAGLYLQVRGNNRALCLVFGREIYEINQAWAQGQDEIVEAFEADFADQVDKVESLKQKYDELNDIVVDKMRAIDVLRERLTESQHIVSMQKEAIEYLDEDKSKLVAQIVEHQLESHPTT